MMNGIFYKGHHSREFGVIVKTKTRPPMPSPRIEEVTVPYRDGTLDYSEWGGRVFYDDKLLEIDMTVPSCDIKMLHKKIAKIVGWLSGGFGELIYDDMPMIKWIAKPIDLSEISTELYRVGTTTVQFRCKPFNEYSATSEGIPLDSLLELDSEITLDYGDDFKQQILNGDNNINISYIGDAPCRPNIYITGLIKKLTLTFNELKLYIDMTKNDFNNYGGIILDCENWACAGVDGTNLTPYINGDFPELSPGTNSFQINSDNLGEVEFRYTPKFLFGEDYIYD